MIKKLFAVACIFFSSQLLAQDGDREGIYTLTSQQVTAYFTINFDGDSAGIIVFGNEADDNDAFWDAYLGTLSAGTITASLAAGDGRPGLTIVFDEPGRATITYSGVCAAPSPESLSCEDFPDPSIQSPGVIVKVL